MKKRASMVFIINDNNEVLMLQRSKNDVWFPGFWGLPGGTSEMGESALDTARRETFEETNLKINNLDILETIDFTRQDTEWKLSYYTAGSWTGEIKLSEEHDAFKWIPLENVENEQTVPNVKILINTYLI